MLQVHGLEVSSCSFLHAHATHLQKWRLRFLAPVGRVLSRFFWWWLEVALLERVRALGLELGRVQIICILRLSRNNIRRRTEQLLADSVAVQHWHFDLRSWERW